jgi:Flp pilus assembly protein TadD
MPKRRRSSILETRRSIRSSESSTSILSDYAGAEKSLEKAVKINPYLTDARNTLGAVYMKTGRLSEARKRVSCSASRTGPTPFRRRSSTTSGTLELEEKRTPEALENFRRAVAANPSYAKGYYGLGQALLRSGKKDEARILISRR